MDLGYPTQWAAKDTVVLIAGFLSIGLTVMALYVKGRADKDVLNATAPEVSVLGEDVTARQERLLVERAVKRYALERSLLRSRTSSALFVLAVVASVVGSMPFILFWVLVISAAGICEYYRRFGLSTKILRRRAGLLDLIREIFASSLSGPLIADSAIYEALERMYSTPDDRIDILERTLELVLIDRKKQLREYKKAHKQP